MANKNKESTRYYSDIQEKQVMEIVGGFQSLNSGAGKFRKGDIVNKDISLMVECKTCMSDKDSFSIKKEWIEKNNEERKTQHLENSCLAFNFGPNQENYFIINEKLMRFLKLKLEEDYQ